MQEERYNDRGQLEKYGYMVSYVEKDGQRLKTLSSHEIINTDQPNKFFVQLKDGKLHVLINENTPFDILAEDAKKIEYISFASPRVSSPEEFFYNCTTHGDETKKLTRIRTIRSTVPSVDKVETTTEIPIKSLLWPFGTEEEEEEEKPLTLEAHTVKTAKN